MKGPSGPMCVSGLSETGDDDTFPVNLLTDDEAGSLEQVADDVFWVEILKCQLGVQAILLSVSFVCWTAGADMCGWLFTSTTNLVRPNIGDVLLKSYLVTGCCRVVVFSQQKRVGNIVIIVSSHCA